MKIGRLILTSGVFIVYTCVKLCFAGAADISPIQVKTTVDKTTITVGDDIVYRIECEDLKGGELEFPRNLKSLGNFEIKGVKVEEKRAVYTLTSFRVGEDTIPSLTLKYKSEGNEFDIKTGAIPITVKSVLTSDIKDIRDIKEPLDIPLNKLPYILGLVGAALIGSGLYLFLKKRRRGGIRAVEVDVRPAHEIAYERLRALKLEEGRIKEYYIELSDIIRRYIEASYCINAPTETTYELLTALKKKKIGYSNVSHIRDFLLGCDLVKFAKYEPSIDEIERDTDSAKGIVDENGEEREA